jgi:hypothetical protein
MCKKVNKTRSYINRSSVHWRIGGRQSCGEIICGSINSTNGCRKKEHHWSGNIDIHRSVGGGTTIHWGTSNGKSTTKGDGD